MKISNKKRVLIFNLLIFSLMIFLILISIFLKINKQHIPFEFLKSTLPIFILILLALSILLVKGLLIFEYEISGEVLSIKNYKWYLLNKKIISPTFEMPQKNILKIEIENIFLKKYLKIFFKNESNRTMIKRIDITGSSNKQIKEMYIHLTHFLIIQDDNMPNQKTKTKRLFKKNK